MQKFKKRSTNLPCSKNGHSTIHIHALTSIQGWTVFFLNINHLLFVASTMTKRRRKKQNKILNSYARFCVHFCSCANSL